MRSKLVFAIGMGAAMGFWAPTLEAQGRVGTPAQRQRAEQTERQREADRQRDADRARIRVNREAQAAAARRQAERWDDRRYDDRRDDRRYDDRYDDRRYDDRGWDIWDRNNRSRTKNGNGPSFCRSGAGHPVFGREWCRDKGFDMRNGRYDRDVWEDIIFRGPRDRRYNQTLGRSVVQDILGSVLLGRFESHARQAGYGGSTSGRWLMDGSSHVLQLFVGNIPVARIVDFNRDGRVDTVQLRN
ncbi:MAG TPA: hypothetical protein VK928_01105 [Longimicrobiales bacterium]|nr:hypothetical protein [Longimicrobiales bacterium]